MKICLLSGLPRSGSTVLRSILEQNEILNVTPYSGLREILLTNISSWNVIPHQAYPRMLAKQRVLKSIINSYHGYDKDIHIDVDRYWPRNIRLFETVTNTKAKVVCLVRPVDEVIASLEKLKQNNPEQSLHDNYEDATIDERMHTHLTGFVGGAYRSLVDAFDSNVGDRLLFVDYNKLCKDPITQLKRIYNHWDLEEFKHTHSNLSLKTKENDEYHGFTELHSIRETLSKVEVNSKDIIGSRLTVYLKETYPSFWEKWT
jgi:sulfotransferase